jgi:phosphopantothenoylcysteine decarboxylase/phosphopantothenate--cysteine ligase
MPNVVLGVSGSVSAYRAADLARDLMRNGANVRVCLTDSAQRFVSPLLFETLTDNPCLSSVFEEPVPGRMAHLDWAREADLVMIAPATANTINRIANGIADDMLSTLALAYEGPAVIAPATNPAMYLHPTVQHNLASLRARGFAIVDPIEGDVAAGEFGLGKLALNGDILAESLAILSRSQRLQGKEVLITSGPTQERIDSVRFLSNGSSGKMGAALAQAALWMGAKVTVVSGPVDIEYPRNATVIPVRSANEMLEAAKSACEDAVWIVGAAAVSDYRPEHSADTKIRRSNEPIDLRLVPNPDIIAELAKSGAKTVGFAAEPSLDLSAAIAKMDRKGLHAIVHNDISNTAIGFRSNENRLTLIRKTGGPVTSEQASKLQCALWLWEQLTAEG